MDINAKIIIILTFPDLDSSKISSRLPRIVLEMDQIVSFVCDAHPCVLAVQNDCDGKEAATCKQSVQDHICCSLHLPARCPRGSTSQFHFQLLRP